MRKRYSLAAVVVGIALLLTACPSTGASQGSAKDQVNQQALDNENKVYVTKNHVELNNYNARLKIADDPTTILWCTSAFPVTGAPLITIPIVGKLTSGGKRPFPSNNLTAVGNSNSTENPDGQGFFGSSGDYRYGFTPEAAYTDFYNLATFCTTAPMIWQKEKTTIALSVDPGLVAATKTAQAQLKAGDPTAANSTLKGAITTAGGK